MWFIFQNNMKTFLHSLFFFGPVTELVLGVVSVLIHVFSYNLEKLGDVGKIVSIVIGVVLTLMLLIEFGFHPLNKVVWVLNSLNLVQLCVECVVFGKEKHNKMFDSHAISYARISVGVAMILVTFFGNAVVIFKLIKKLKFVANHAYGITFQDLIENDEPFLQLSGVDLEEGNQVDCFIKSKKPFHGSVTINYRSEMCRSVPLAPPHSPKRQQEGSKKDDQSGIKRSGSKREDQSKFKGSFKEKIHKSFESLKLYLCDVCDGCKMSRGKKLNANPKGFEKILSEQRKVEGESTEGTKEGDTKSSSSSHPTNEDDNESASDIPTTDQVPRRRKFGEIEEE